MKSIFIVILSGFFLAASCSKEELPDIQTDNNGVIISLPYIWRKSLHNNQGFHSNSYIIAPIYYNDNIAIPTTNGENNRLMSLINPDNGETLWSWDDRYQPETEYIDIKYYHQYNNLLTYQKGDRSYCINMDNGTTQWKFRRNTTFDVRINSYGENGYFTYGKIVNEDGNFEQIAYLGNIQNGELTEFLRANLSSDYVAPIGVGGIIYVNQVPDNDNLLLVTYAEPLPDWEVNSFFGLYDTVNEEWVWDRKLLSPPTVNTSVFTPPQFINGKIIANVGKKLVCHSLDTGEQIWSKQFPQDFMFSGFIIVENKIIANNEDTYTYCLDPANGNIIWKTKTAGTSGRMSYLNGIVYFVGGSTGKLHAIDISTGKHVWKLDANLFEDNSQGSRSYKTNAIYVLKAEGNKPARIIALSHYYAYCFKAYR